MSNAKQHIRSAVTAPRQFATWWISEFRRGCTEETRRTEEIRAGLNPPQSPEHARIRQVWRDADLLTPHRTRGRST